jgi:hypothetical protein
MRHKSKRSPSGAAYSGSIMCSSPQSKSRGLTKSVASSRFTVQPLSTGQIRLYSRDLELSNKNVLHREILAAPIVILSLVDNSLLAYGADNVLRHFLIIPTADAIRLHACGTISFDGVIAAPSAVRVLSWMIPSAQKRECPVSGRPTPLIQGGP